MKHVIIAGASRSGKTTLSLKLREHGFTHYKMDTIKRGLDNNFYDGRIELWKDASPKFARLIGRIIRESETDIINNVEWYVIDTCHLYPKDIKEINPKNTVIVFLGYPEISEMEKLKAIRDNDPSNGWTRTKDDEFLLKGTRMDIEYSIEAKKQCDELGIKFFNTGTNFNETILEAYDYIMTNM